MNHPFWVYALLIYLAAICLAGRFMAAAVGRPAVVALLFAGIAVLAYWFWCGLRLIEGDRAAARRQGRAP